MYLSHAGVQSKFLQQLFETASSLSWDSQQVATVLGTALLVLVSLFLLRFRLRSILIVSAGIALTALGMFLVSVIIFPIVGWSLYEWQIPWVIPASILVVQTLLVGIWLLCIGLNMNHRQPESRSEA